MFKVVAKRLLGTVRRGDTVARLSDDEFTLVFASLADMDDASRVAQKIPGVFDAEWRQRATGVLAITAFVLYLPGNGP